MKHLLTILLVSFATVALGCDDASTPSAGDIGASTQPDASAQDTSTFADAEAPAEVDAVDIDDVVADAWAPSTPDATASPDDASASEPDVDEPVTVDAGSGAEPLPPGLHGEAPPDALPLPEFVATNYDGGLRGPEDLTGQPTVLWFFPFAGTPG